jgi:ATP-dependent Lon protease
MWDVVAFDEVAGITFKDKDGVQNQDHGIRLFLPWQVLSSQSYGICRQHKPKRIETLVKTSHLLAPFPEAMIDTAFFDRFMPISRLGYP